MDCFPLEGFNHMTNIGALICDLFVWSGCWRFSVFWEYLVYPNMVPEHLWRAAFGFDQDLKPVCCSCNFSQIYENFGPSLLILFAPLRYMFGLFEASFSCYLGFHLGLCMCWDVRLSSSYDVLSLRSKMGLPFVVFWRSGLVLLLEKRHRFFISSKKIMTLIRSCRMIEFHRCGPRIH